MRTLFTPFLFGVVSFLPALAMAQEGVSAEPETQSLLQLLDSAEWVKWPLLALSVAIFGLVIFNFFWFRKNRLASAEFIKEAESTLKGKDLPHFRDLCNDSNDSCAKVLNKVLTFAKDNPEADMTAVDKIAESEGARRALSINLPNTLLMDLGVMAPMVGLFGTVIGILRSFGELASDDSPMRSVMLAGGVSQALVATAMGLAIGLFAMAFYAYFRFRVSTLIGYFEATLSDLMERTKIAITKDRASRATPVAEKK
ncbi:MAG: MotA/TolQ/ExbB proton channel family protein [Verrucomicrobiota bacterium]